MVTNVSPETSVSFVSRYSRQRALEWTWIVPISSARSARDRDGQGFRVGRFLVHHVRWCSVRLVVFINPLNAELNPICCLLALLGAHHFLHVNRIRVKSLTLRLLMPYIYIYIYIYIYLFIYIYIYIFIYGISSLRVITGTTPYRTETCKNFTLVVIIWYITYKTKMRFLPWCLEIFPFQTRSQNCEKRLPGSSCLSVASSARPFAWNSSYPTWRIFMQIDIWVFFENLSRKFNLN